jgi:hypothetical protein
MTMNLTTLSDRHIEALLTGNAPGDAEDVRALSSCLSEMRAAYAAAPPPFVGKELAALLTEGLPAPAVDTRVRRQKATRSRDSLKTWGRRASLRLGVGAVGLFGFCAGMGAANALPSPAQLVVARVAHAFSIDMPAPQSDRPLAGHGEVAPSTATATSVPGHTTETSVVGAGSASNPAPAAAAASTASSSGQSSTGSRPSSSDRRGGSGTKGKGGHSGSGSASGSSSSDGSLSPTGSDSGVAGAPDVRRADDTTATTTATTEVEVHHAGTPSPNAGGGGSGGGGR